MTLLLEPGITAFVQPLVLEALCLALLGLDKLKDKHIELMPLSSHLHGLEKLLVSANSIVVQKPLVALHSPDKTNHHVLELEKQLIW